HKNLVPLPVILPHLIQEHSLPLTSLLLVSVVVTILASRFTMPIHPIELNRKLLRRNIDIKLLVNDTIDRSLNLLIRKKGLDNLSQLSLSLRRLQIRVATTASLLQ